MDKSQSPPVGSLNANVKARRLKILQELEDRRLQLSNERLSKAQRKVCRQLELQRMQFTRRFSESSFNPALLSDGGMESSKFGSTSEIVDTHLFVNEENEGLDLAKDTESKEQPFWLRLRSLGVLPDEDGANKTSNSMDTTLLDKTASAENLCVADTTEEKSSFADDVTRVPRRTISVVQDYHIRPGISLDDFTSKDADMAPAWLIALHQLRRDRLDFNPEKRAELAALMSGNKACDAKNFLIPNLNTSSKRDSKASKPQRHSILGPPK